MRIRDLAKKGTPMPGSSSTTDVPSQPEPADHLKYLRALTEALPSLSRISVGVGTSGVVHYEVGDGTCIGFSLWNDGNIAVQRVFLSAGTKFPAHIHTGHEWVMVFSGNAIFQEEGSDPITLQPGSYVYDPPERAHCFTAITDCWALAVTIPADEGYPRNAGT